MASDDEAKHDLSADTLSNIHSETTPITIHGEMEGTGRPREQTELSSGAKMGGGEAETLTANSAHKVPFSNQQSEDYHLKDPNGCPESLPNMKSK